MHAKKMIVFSLVAVLGTFSWGQEIIKKRGKSPNLFEVNDVLELTLVQNIKALKKDIDEDRSYHPAQLSYMDRDNQKVTLNVSVKTRGKTRRNPRLCDSPPLAIKFSSAETKETIFRKQKKLKMVTHCKRKKGIYEQYLLMEYLVYRLYNILTEKSFRVRLAYITYVDSKGKHKPLKKCAFFIEDEKKMAKRNNGKLDESKYKYWVFQKKEAQILLSVFQFMIGNTDWSIPGRHNVKIIWAGPENKLFAVPYDFDMSGIINTSYAKPHEKLHNKIKDVRSRLYRGICRKQEEFAPVSAWFNKKKEEIYALYNNFPPLNSRYKKNNLRYIDRFYEIINNPRLVKKYLVENCKKLR
jgi:hypothetical protein